MQFILLRIQIISIFQTYIFDFDKYLLESQLGEKYNVKWSELEEYDITPSMFEAKKHYDDYRMERLDFVTNIEGDEKDKSTIIFKDLIKDTDFYHELSGDEEFDYEFVDKSSE